MMEDVAIFWDYENCSAPANTSGYALVQSIRSMMQTYGSVKTLRAYVGITEQFTTPKTQPIRSELQCSGVSLIDCPHNGRKDVADKMMIVDMLAHAIDNPYPSTIVLISGDRDFAYALSILRLRGYRIILCTTSSAHLSLVSQASECVDWANLCATAADVTGPQWAVMNRPATPKILIHRPNSQGEAETSVPPCGLSQELKEQDDSVPFVRERKRSTTTFSSSSNGFGDPKSIVEFVPSSSKKPAFSFKWPINGSPKKSFTNMDPLNFQPSHMFDKSQRTSLTNDTIIEDSDMGTAAPTSPPFLQNIASSSSRSSSTFFDNDIKDGDSSQDTISTADDVRLNRHNPIAPNETAERQLNSQALKVPSPMPLPNFVFSSSNSSVFASGLASPFGGFNSNQGYIPSNSGQKLSNFATTKPPASPRKLNYSAGVPAHFVILIKVLQAQLRDGKERVLRSQVGEQIYHKGVTYQKAGVSKFSEYVNMAQEAGIVELGGSDGKAWIALTSDCRTIYVA